MNESVRFKYLRNIQYLKCMYYKLKYYITKGYTHDYKIELNENVIIANLNGEKIKGKVISIDEIKDNDEFISYAYKIHTSKGNYIISDNKILCVLEVEN